MADQKAPKPTFEEAYAKLNPAQKEAVDAVEGPVLVIAGPGTGKTHILTLRIANILRVTQASPDSILVLTFTDSASRTVARRLAGLIGEEAARKVGTFTFHSFAESVMKDYPEAFPEYTDRRLMGEVEQVLLWRHILSTNTVEHVATPKSPFHYLRDLMSLEDNLTRECISLAEYRAWLDEEAKRIEADPTHRYVRGANAGEMKPSGFQRIERLAKGREAADLIEKYRAAKDERGVYGYTDVLAITVAALKGDEALRADLQERYQYVLADEHQDANALQHALLDSLAFDEHPNLFIVGDEKQAIFGFQGADSTHFRTFLELYPRTKVITLTENFRSFQGILDLSHTLLKDLPSSTGEHAQLQASRGTGGQMHLLIADDALAERDQIAQLVEEAITGGTLAHEIAIITRKNATADLFAQTLRARGIPTLRAGDIDLEGRPVVRYFIALLEAVANPNANSRLREALLAPWWDAPISERAALLQRSNDRELAESLAAAFPDIAETISMLREQARVVPPMSLFSRILFDTGARAFLLSRTEGIHEDLPLIRALMMHIEDLARRDPNATFPEIMESFSQAREHEIGSIRTTLTEREGQVTVITAHKAKGMEFKRVFVTALTAREWEGRGKSSLIPSPFDNTREHEETVRLFYVALTRARDELVLSYGAADGSGKEQAPISILPDGVPLLATAPSDPLPAMHSTITAPELVRELTTRYLLTTGLSPSAYNEYLASPPTFFARRVLRLSEPETRAAVVGTAVHAAVAEYLRTHELSPEERRQAAHAEMERALRRSLLPRGDSFDQMARHARSSLDSYLASANLDRETVAIEEVFSLTRTVAGQEVLLKGKVDAVFKTPGGECIVDFKTSSSLTGKKEGFERQLAFYDLLLRANDHETNEALIVLIGEDNVEEHPIALTDATRSELNATLDIVLAEMISGEWREGEPSEYDDLLTLFK